MNILYLCADPGIPVRGTKGASVHVRAMTDAFAEIGHPTTLITPRAGPMDGPAPRARLLEVACESTSEDREARAREISQAIHQAAMEELGREKYDLIYERYSLWSDAGAMLAQSNGIPLVLEVNAPLCLEASRYRTLKRDDLATNIERRAFSAAHTIAVVSEPLRDYVVAHGADAARVHVLPNAVDEKIFHLGVDARAIRNELGLTEKFVVGFIGTAKPWHDLDTLIEAVARLRQGESQSRPYELLLIGDFPESVPEKIERKGLADHTTMVRPIPHIQVPAYLAAMDVAVSPHPALADFYFSPLKLFEYLACGVATIASDVAPVRQVIANGATGLLYPPGDASALAHSIARLARDKALRTRIAWAGARRVLGRHTWKRNAEQVIALVRGNTLQLDDPMLPLFDDKLGTYLFRATRADLAAPLLAAHLTRNDWDSIAQIQILKYKPCRRCVLAYDLATKSKEKISVIGKVFKDERGTRHLAFQRALWAGGFGMESADGITIAEPLAYVPEMRMLVVEHVPGETLGESTGAPDFSERVCRSAAAIAKLHSARIRPSKQYTLVEEAANLAHWAEEVVACRGDSAEWVARQLEALRAMASRLPRAEAVPAHRDFYYSQLLFASRRVTLIDLDMFSLADPAIDVANFIAHLRFLSLQKFSDAHRLDGAAAWFLDAYARDRAGSNGEGFSVRVAFYQAATYFRLLHVVLKRPYWRHWFDALAELTEQSIANQQ